MESLPNELVYQIFENIDDFKTQLIINLVDRRFAEITRRESYQRILKRKYSLLVGSIKDGMVKRIKAILDAGGNLEFFDPLYPLTMHKDLASNEYYFDGGKCEDGHLKGLCVQTTVKVKRIFVRHSSLEFWYQYGAVSTPDKRGAFVIIHPRHTLRCLVKAQLLI